MKNIENEFSYPEAGPRLGTVVSPRLLERAKKATGGRELQPEDVKEIVFSVIIADKIIDGLTQALRECKFPQEEIDDIKESLSALPPEDILQALSIPWELRRQRFQAYKSAFERGEINTRDIVADLLASAKENGFTIGYHRSQQEVNPEPSPRSPLEKTWSIKGYEMDDRDNRLMAYYSLDYKNLYRKRTGNYLYLIRAQPVPGSGHKIDTSNQWGRASMLSVIDKIDLKAECVDEKVHDIAEELKRRSA